jgi:hypothetical protein
MRNLGKIMMIIDKTYIRISNKKIEIQVILEKV